MSAEWVDSRDVLKEHLAQDPAFREHWVHSALARAVAIAVIRYRAEHDLSQRGLAKLLGIPQPHVSRLEIGERHPTPETLARLSKKLGLRFCLEIGPAAAPEDAIAIEDGGGGTQVLTVSGVSITTRAG
jgi:ribosome-binding protein aMBF1 (putative translation factor)